MKPTLTLVAALLLKPLSALPAADAAGVMMDIRNDKTLDKKADIPIILYL